MDMTLISMYKYVLDVIQINYNTTIPWFCLKMVGDPWKTHLSVPGFLTYLDRTSSPETEPHMDTIVQPHAALSYQMSNDNDKII